MIFSLNLNPAEAISLLTEKCLLFLRKQSKMNVLCLSHAGNLQTFTTYIVTIQYKLISQTNVVAMDENELPGCIRAVVSNPGPGDPLCMLFFTPASDLIYIIGSIICWIMAVGLRNWNQLRQYSLVGKQHTQGVPRTSIRVLQTMCVCVCMLVNAFVCVCMCVGKKACWWERCLERSHL